MMKHTGPLMHRVQLNHGLHSSKKGVVWLSIGLISICCTVYIILHLRSQMTALESYRYVFQPEIVSKPIRLPASQLAKKQEEIKAVQDAMSELALPWEPLFNMLEALHVPQVRVMTIAPNAKQHKLRLTAESTTFTSMLNYASLLGRQRLLKDVFLLNHEQATDGRAMPFSFVVEAIWLN